METANMNSSGIYTLTLVQRLLCIFIVVVCTPLQADTTWTDDEIDNFNIFTSTHIPEPNLANNFYEKVDPWSGQLTLSHTDLHLPGNGGMDLDIVRQYATPTKNFSHERTPLFFPNQGKYRMGFGWDIHFGYITHTFWGSKQTMNDWMADGLVSESNGSGISCSMPERVSDNGTFTRSWGTYWDNMQLVTQGGGRESLANAISNDYDLVTKGGWRGNCAGTGFILYSPEGLKYTFDEVKYTAYSDRGSLSGSTYSYAWYVSKIEDRFGNWINITYKSGDQALIEKVTASDGREVVFSYTDVGGYPALTSLSAHGEIISYQYDSQRNLANVTIGERDLWTYTYQPYYQWYERSTIYLLRTLTTEGGGVIEYSYDRKGRSYAGSFQHHVVTERKTTGILPISESQYSYYGGTDSSALNSYGDGVNVNVSISNNHAFTTVVEDNRCTNYVFNDVGQGNWLVGTLAKQKIYGDSQCSKLLEEVNYQWDQVKISEQGVSRSFFAYYVGLIGDIIDDAYWKPVLREKTITREGATYITEYSNFTPFGKPGTIKETNSQGEQRSTEYTFTSSPYQLGLEWEKNQLVKDGNGKVINQITREFDSLYQIKKVTSNGITQYYSYNADGSLYQITDGRNNTLTLSNYFRGVPRSLSDIIGTKTRTVDDFGNILSFIDEKVNTTSYKYDNINRLRQVTPPVGAIINYDYSKGTYYEKTCITETVPYETNGNVTVFIDVETCTYDTEYRPKLLNAVIITQGNFRQTRRIDGYNRAVQLKDEDLALSLTRYSNLTYDPDGNLIFESIPSDIADETIGNALVVDALNRPIEQISPIGSVSYEYLTGQKIEQEDANGNVSIYTYRGFGAPDYSDIVQMEHPSSSGAIFTVTQRDEVGRLTKVTQGGFSTDYTYHSVYLDKVKTETQPQLTLYYDYDAVGNLVSKHVNGSGITRFEYDTRNRLSKTDYPSGTYDVTYTYDETNNLKTAINGIGDWIYDYDALGKLTDMLLVTNGKQFDFLYDYDQHGHLQSLDYSLPGNVKVDYQPNAFGQATRAGNYASAVKYHPQGSLKSFTYGNGISYELGLSVNKTNIDKILGRNGSNIVINRSYSYDGEINVTGITDHLNSTYSVNSFSYDGLNRLTQASSSSWGGQIRYSYDKMGNITSQTFPNETKTYSYDPATNLLTKVVGSSSRNFTYDIYGNINNNGRHNLIYNDAGQLISAAEGQSSKVYLYDAMGQRVQVIDNDGEVEYEVHDRQGRLLLVEEEDGTYRRKVYLGNKAIAQDRNSDVQFLHFDTLGSTIAVSNASGQLTGEHYQPYGDKVVKPQGTNNDQWYTGKRFDSDINLAYYGARYYDPELGRFYSNDPVGYLGHLNRGNPVQGFGRYTYANNNPYKYVDPDGEFGLLGAAVGGGIGFIASVATQKFTGDGKINWGTVAAATVTGAAVGATGGLAAGAVAKIGLTGVEATAAVAVPSATVAYVGGATTQVIENLANEAPMEGVHKAGAVSAAGTVVGGVLGPAETAALTKSSVMGAAGSLTGGKVTAEIITTVTQEAVTQTTSAAASAATSSCTNEDSCN